jgi:tetratricopeptide (TPR) repeat protein
VSLAAAGRELVVRDDTCLWSPESGQCHLDFAPPSRHAPVELPRRNAEAPAPASARNADDWVRLGSELEPGDPAGARGAYEAALALDPQHADAHVNLGCLEHEIGRLERAESHYRAALAARPDDAVARFDLAVALEDRQRLDEARKAYEAALRADPRCAEAHHNLARVCEQLGDRAAALRHWGALRRLVLAEI